MPYSKPCALHDPISSTDQSHRLRAMQTYDLQPKHIYFALESA